MCAHSHCACLCALTPSSRSWQVLRIFYLSRRLGPFVLMLIQMFYDVYIWLLLLVPVLIGFTAALVVIFRDAGSCVSTQDGFSASALALLEIMLGRWASWRAWLHGAEDSRRSTTPGPTAILPHSTKPLQWHEPLLPTSWLACRYVSNITAPRHARDAPPRLPQPLSAATRSTTACFLRQP